MEDLIGKKFGRLLVLKNHSKKQKFNSRGIKDGYIYYYLCQCDCGKETVADRNSLRFGKTKSCGCLKSELSAERKFTHKLSKTRLFRLYHNMINRCTNKKVKCYYNYGGRGINVCTEWLESFESFYNWAINNGYSEDLTIDRINVNGNYEPSNCRWLTAKEQASNKRSNHFITYNNETHTIAEWSRITNIKAPTIRKRIKDYGYSVEKALTQKV